MNQDGNNRIDRRGALECMVWTGTGVLWTLTGGVPRSWSLLGTSEANAQVASGFTFLQISDSHIGYKGQANPDPMTTLNDAIARVRALRKKPAFMVHTGDITHLSKASEFDNAEQAIGAARLDTFYVPGEHDIIDADRGKAYLDRYGRKVGAKGTGWYSFDQGGVHFIGLVNVADLTAGGMGALGAEQLAWLEADVKGRSASTPIVVMAHIPLWTVNQAWGWGTEDGMQALTLLKRFGSVTVLNGHIHQVMQKVEGGVTFHTARSTAFPQPAPGTASAPGPLKVPAEQLRTLLGIATIDVRQGTEALAITDAPLVAS